MKIGNGKLKILWDKVWKNYFLYTKTEGYYSEIHSEIIAFIRKAKAAKAERILDIGCGDGYYSTIFAKNGFFVTAMDISEEALKIFIQKIQDFEHKEKIKIMNLSLEEIGEGNFDIIFAHRVLYHCTLEMFNKYIKIIWKLLAQDGIFFVSLLEYDKLKIINSESEKGKNVIIPCSGLERGIPHIYVNNNMLRKVKRFFKIVKVKHFRINSLQKGYMILYLCKSSNAVKKWNNILQL